MLVSAGNVKRDRIQRIKEHKKSSGDSNVDETSIAENLPEQEVCIFIDGGIMCVIWETDVEILFSVDFNSIGLRNNGS